MFRSAFDTKTNSPSNLNTSLLNIKPKFRQMKTRIKDTQWTENALWNSDTDADATTSSINHYMG